MPDRLIHIARHEELLGKYPEPEVLALLEADFLKPTDDYWIEGMPDWQPLAGLLAANDKKPPLLDRAKASMATAGSSIGDSAKSLANKARSLGTRSGQAVAETRRKLLEDYLPHIKALLGQKLSAPVLNAARAAINNEALMAKTFGAAYDCLPKPVRRFVAEKEFVEFCLEHRRKLLGAGPPTG